MSNIRHWKEKFDADAEFVYAKTFKLGADLYVKPGDPVDKSMFGKNVKARLRRWWDSRVIRRADFVAPASITSGRCGEIQTESAEPEAAVVGPAMEHIGGPWYVVKHGDQEIRVKGRSEAEKVMEDLR